MVEVSAVNLDEQLVLLSSGELIPIVKMVDLNGDETFAVDDAIAIVAGPMEDDLWMVIDLALFESAGSLH